MKILKCIVFFVSFLLAGIVCLEMLSQDPSGDFIRSIQQGDLSAVEAAIEGEIDVNMVLEDHTTPLMQAIHRNNLDIVKLLLSNGADVNLRTGREAMH